MRAAKLVLLALVLIAGPALVQPALAQPTGPPISGGGGSADPLTVLGPVSPCEDGQPAQWDGASNTKLKCGAAEPDQFPTYVDLGDPAFVYNYEYLSPDVTFPAATVEFYITAPAEDFPLTVLVVYVPPEGGLFSELVEVTTRNTWTATTGSAIAVRGYYPVDGDWEVYNGWSLFSMRPTGGEATLDTYAAPLDGEINAEQGDVIVCAGTMGEYTHTIVLCRDDVWEGGDMDGICYEIPLADDEMETFGDYGSCAVATEDLEGMSVVFLYASPQYGFSIYDPGLRRSITQLGENVEASSLKLPEYPTEGQGIVSDGPINISAKDFYGVSIKDFLILKPLYVEPTATAGTIAFDGVNGLFCGYTGSAWVSFSGAGTCWAE